MINEPGLVSVLKRTGKYSVYVVAGLLLLVWWLETPAGILGKADAVGYAVCHRIDLRSFHIGIRQFPLCARCTGQYVGAMLGLLIQAVLARGRSGFPPKGAFIIFGLLGLAYAVDGVNSYLYMPTLLKVFPRLPHLYVPSNTLRLLTGTGIGLVIASLIYPAFVGSIIVSPDARPAIGGTKAIFGMIVLGIVADVLILMGSPYVLYIAALLSAAGVVVLLSMAYSVVILRFFGKENTYHRLLQVSLPVVCGFLLAISQIALFDMVRMLITGTWGGFGFG